MICLCIALDAIAVGVVVPDRPYQRREHHRTQGAVVTIPQDIKRKFVIVDGYFLEPRMIHHQDARSVTLHDGRRFER